MVKLRLFNILGLRNLKYFLALILLCHVNILYAQRFEITVSGEIESDSASKEKEFLLQLKHKDKKAKYLNKLSLNFDNGYDKDTNSKIKELFDYEQSLFIYRESKKNFFSLYFRYKDDKFQDSETQNYSIYSLGYGIEKKHEQEQVRLSLSIGEKHSKLNSTVIITPSAEYKNEYKKFAYLLSSRLTSGDGFRVFTNKITVTYPFTEKLSLKYMIKYESSKDNEGKEFERLNKLALVIKF